MANLFDFLRSSLVQNDDGGGPDITVTGRGIRPIVEQDGPQTNVSNRQYNQELADVQANQPQRRGTFGAKGTLRDILGTLGDAFLVQSGNKPVYGPRREQEQNADAIAGFTENPLAAIERLGHNDPAAAQELYKTYQTNQLKNAQLQSLNASREDTAQSRQDRRNDIFYKRASNMLAGAETPEDVAAVSQLIRDTASKYSQAGSPIDISWLPDNITPEQAETLGNSGIDRYKQEQIPIAQQNADSRRISAQKQPAPRNPPRRGLTDVDADVADAVLRGNPTEAQSKYYNDRLKKTTKSSALRELISGGTTQPTNTGGFRIVGKRPKQ